MTAWPWVPLVLAAAFAFGSLVVRASSSHVLRSGQRPLLAMAALVWLSAIGSSASVLVLQGETPIDRLAYTVFVAVGLGCAMPALRDILAVLSLTSSGRVELHDHIRMDAPTLEGRVVSIGLRRTVVRTEDSVDVSVPNRRLEAHSIHRLARASDRSGVPVELEVPLEDGMDARRVCNRMFEAAMLSPFAVPGRPADVQLVATTEGRSSIRLRGWVAHHGLSSRYRGDVLQRLRDDGARGSNDT